MTYRRNGIRRRVRSVVERLSRPRPLLVTVAGPDGCGKSTVAAGLVQLGIDLRLSTTRQHFRPGALPRPGALAGRPERRSASPHAETPHGHWTSALLLAYFWLD